MKYVIIGAGGTGGAIGGFLARAGKDVTLIDRGEHLEKIQQRGLYFETPDGEYMVHVSACSMEEYQGTPDAIFVCVKSYSLQEVIPFIKRVAAAHTIVIPILNIYGIGGKLQEQLPGITVTDGCIYIASEIKEPGTILLSGKIFRVVFGLRKDTDESIREQVTPALEEIELDLELAGITPRLSAQIEKDALQRFSFVSPLAAVCAGYDVNAWAVQNPGPLQDVFKALIGEVKALSNAMGYNLPDIIVDINMRVLNGLEPTATSSLHRDLRNGNESELDGLVFEVVRMGRHYGVDMPVYEEIAKRFPSVVEDVAVEEETVVEEVEAPAYEEAVETPVVEEVEPNETIVEEAVEKAACEEVVAEEAPACEEADAEEVSCEEPVVEEPIAEEITEEVPCEENSADGVVVEEPEYEEAVIEEAVIEEAVIEEEAGTPVYEEAEPDEIVVERAVEESYEEIAEENSMTEEVAEIPTYEETVDEEPVAEDVSCEEFTVEEEEPEDSFVYEETVAEEEEDPFVWEEVEEIEETPAEEEFSFEDLSKDACEEAAEDEATDNWEATEDEDGNPIIRDFGDGSRYWTKTYDKFEAKIYLPESDPITDIVNFGFMTPYLLVFEEEKRTPAQAKAFADESGLTAIATPYGGSVVFIYPTNEGGWEEADEELFISLISNTKISQYYHDGMAVMRNRFTGEWGESYIRGALLRSYLYGYGKSADYIAKNLLKTIEGDGLFGKGDITPVICVLENLSVVPQPERRDIPVVSVGNSDEINEALTAGLDAVLVKDSAEYVNDFYSFMKKYRRMVGFLDEEPNLEEMGVEVEADYCVVPTAADNRGDDADTTEHKIGYVAYYNRGIMNKEEVPLVLCFHGGGDSAMCMVALSDWHRVVADNDFLLVSVENHLNSTATEMMHLLAHLKDKYSIDTERIYATGFSMGGCKSWDMFQEYPYVFAALAPMDATFDVGLNVYGQPVEDINRTIPVPVFYVGGEQTPLPELPFQEEKCTNRMAYVLEVNKSKTKYDVKFEDRASWVNPIWGIDGDVICRDKDDNRGSVLTMHLFESENGCCYSVFGSGSPQQHEMRYLNCKNAWKFFKQFRRLPNGDLVGGLMDEVISALNEE